MNTKTRKMTTIAMICAVAYAIMAVCRIAVVPSAPFLNYDPADIVITIGGFIYGPLAAFAASLIVATIEMFTVSDSGIIGMIMNVISTCGFACTASLIYKKKKSILTAVIGLFVGVFVMTGLMLLWNYLITPIYMGQSRELVASMLVPIFLPFNLIKGGLNSAATFLLYKPLVTALRRAKLLEISEENKVTKKGMKIGFTLVSLLVLITCILIILVWNQVI